MLEIMVSLQPSLGTERAGQGRKGSSLISDSRFNASTIKDNSPDSWPDGMRRLFSAERQFG
jgi:hypothetical protein